jgi:hypothetical protein
MLAVAFGGLIKIQNAYKHAERIAKNKRRALKKTNDMIKVFFTYDTNKLDMIKNAVYGIKETAEEKQIEEEINYIPQLYFESTH